MKTTSKCRIRCNNYVFFNGLQQLWFRKERNEKKKKELKKKTKERKLETPCSVSITDQETSNTITSRLEGF